MKKLIIAAFAVAFAAVAQAATINWGANKGYLYDGSGSTTKLTSGDAYLMFVTTTFTQDNLVNAFASFEGDAGKTLEAMSNSGALASATGTIGANARIAGTSTYNLTSDATAYFVVFANDKMYVSIEGAVAYDSVMQEGTVAFESITSSSRYSSFDAANGNQGAGWYAVPEPTSALMLLVGLAGLALKRKVA